MAGIEDSGQSNTGLQWLDHDSVHLVIDNMSNLAEINWVDDLVITVLFISIEILSLTAVTCEESASS
jgi:hypothetical protein